MRAAVVALLAAALMAPAATQAGGKARLQSLAGDALVIDGDTIMLSLTKIRMLGIDAPEGKQTCQRVGLEWPCGIEAAAALADLVKDKNVSCDLNGRHSYGRPLGRCRVGGTDLGAWMVAQGWAVVDPRFEQTYLPQQAEAKAAKRGMWAGTFQTPCQFRGSC